MLSRLTRTGRLKAGWCLALAYLLCVLAPSLSFAFAAEGRAAPCITENHSPAMDVGAVVHHVHEGEALQDHSHHASAAHEDKIHQDAGVPAKGSHKGTDNRCCNLVSPSAIPAPEVIVTTPAPPCSRCLIESASAMPDNAPPARYRPPIS